MNIQGVKTLEFENKELIAIAMISPEKERVQFKNNCPFRQADVEHQMKAVLDSMTVAMKHVIKLAFSAFQSEDAIRSEWALNFPCQALSLL